MTAPRNKVLVCNCNRTMKLDAKCIGTALDMEAAPVIHSELCGRQIATFEGAVKSGGDLLVACTQEAPLFGAVHAEMRASSTIRFTNIRETAGWSDEGGAASPKIAALLAVADLPAQEPVPVVSYVSNGEVLIVGPAALALQWAERLREQLHVSVLVTSAAPGVELPLERNYPVYSGVKPQINGWLGEYTVSWEQDNPLDLAACTRCNACIAACPEHAIGFDYQIDLARCKAHRDCVTACGEVKAIDFGRRDRARSERFDLILDLSAQPLIAFQQPPQGYFAPGADPQAQAEAARALVASTGEFDKPKYFSYRAEICAHSRAEITGCTRCIDVCSTRAISPDGDRVRIEPHLCMGCGACASTCPSGAVSYAFPQVAETGLRLKTLLQTYAKAGGKKKACVLFHNEAEGRELLLRLGRQGKGLPAHVLPLPAFHIASLGIDTMLGAIAYGAAEVSVLSAGTETVEYRDSLREQMSYAQQILTALGYGAGHFRLIEAADVAQLNSAVRSMTAATSVPSAVFNLSNEKRTTLDFIFDHLLRHAPAPAETIPLDGGAPFGAVAVDRGKCTLCMACVGACPEGALLDSKERPQLKFIERNCVQCGLCVKTCPEDALALVPRLGLGPEVKTPVVLNEAEVFGCIKCGKPFATRQMIDGMLARLGAHSMFQQSGALDRLKMCADCRVVDLMGKGDHGSIFDYK